jgi:hypothetical protein
MPLYLKTQPLKRDEWKKRYPLDRVSILYHLDQTDTMKEEQKVRWMEKQFAENLKRWITPRLHVQMQLIKESVNKRRHLEIQAVNKQRKKRGLSLVDPAKHELSIRYLLLNDQLYPNFYACIDYHLRRTDSPSVIRGMATAQIIRNEKSIGEMMTGFALHKKVPVRLGSHKTRVKKLKAESKTDHTVKSKKEEEEEEQQGVYSSSSLWNKASV